MGVGCGIQDGCQVTVTEKEKELAWMEEYLKEERDMGINFFLQEIIRLKKEGFIKDQFFYFAIRQARLNADVRERMN